MAPATFLETIRDLLGDPEQRSLYRADPARWKAAHGLADWADDEVSDALGFASESLPVPQAVGVLSAIDDPQRVLVDDRAPTTPTESADATNPFDRLVAVADDLPLGDDPAFDLHVATVEPLLDDLDDTAPADAHEPVTPTDAVDFGTGEHHEVVVDADAHGDLGTSLDPSLATDIGSDPDIEGSTPGMARTPGPVDHHGGPAPGDWLLDDHAGLDGDPGLDDAGLDDHAGLDADPGLDDAGLDDHAGLDADPGSLDPPDDPVPD